MAFMRRPYLMASLAAHAALLALLYYYSAYEPAIAAQERQLGESRLLDRHAEMRRHVADMEQIEALMRASEGKTDAVPETVRFDATTAESPEELLARAEALSKKIDAMGEQARVDDYARITGQDKEKAAAQLEASASAPQPPQDAQAAQPGAAPQPEAQAAPAASEPQASTEPGQAKASASGAADAAASVPGAGDSASAQSGAGTGTGTGGGAGVEARIEALERRARDVLAQRQRQMEREQQGVQVGGAQADDPKRRGLAGRIASFIRGDTSGVSTGGYWGNGDFFDHGPGQIPAVDRTAMRKGMGHKLGPGGDYANRVYVNNWYLIGPFPGKHGRDMFATDSFPPERAVVLDAAYRGKDGRVLTWHHVEAPAYPLMPPDMAEDSVYYGYTELMMDSDRDLAMWIGADDDAQVWINDRLEWKGGNVNKLSFFQKVYDDWNGYAAAYNMNEGKVTVHFRKGRNKVFFKLSNGPNQAFFSMVLTPP
jgi:hypothetical protein